VSSVVGSNHQDEEESKNLLTEIQSLEEFNRELFLEITEARQDKVQLGYLCILLQ
jgi:hypothetical protein